MAERRSSGPLLASTRFQVRLTPAAAPTAPTVIAYPVYPFSANRIAASAQAAITLTQATLERFMTLIFPEIQSRLFPGQRTAVTLVPRGPRS